MLSIAFEHGTVRVSKSKKLQAKRRFVFGAAIERNGADTEGGFFAYHNTWLRDDTGWARSLGASLHQMLVYGPDLSLQDFFFLSFQNMACAGVEKVVFVYGWKGPAVHKNARA